MYIWTIYSIFTLFSLNSLSKKKKKDAQLLNRLSAGLLFWSLANEETTLPTHCKIFVAVIYRLKYVIILYPWLVFDLYFKKIPI